MHIYIYIFFLHLSVYILNVISSHWYFPVQYQQHKMHFCFFSYIGNLSLTMRNLPPIVIFTYLIKLPVCHQSSTSFSTLLLHGGLSFPVWTVIPILDWPYVDPPHSIWVIPLYEYPLDPALAVISLSGCLSSGMLASAPDSLPKLLSPHVDTLSSGCDTHSAPPLSPCTDDTYSARVPTLHGGLLPAPIPHPGLPMLCHVDALLTLLSPHLPTMDCLHLAWMLSSPHLGLGTPLWGTETHTSTSNLKTFHVLVYIIAPGLNCL